MSETLPALVERAAARLVNATSAAEVLEARDAAGFAYDAAKRAARLAKAKGAHDALIAAAHRAQADALEIEAAAKRRLADEYDAAQERGEIRKQSDNQAYSKAEKAGPADIGLTPKQIHEARQVRDAEQTDPGIVKRTLDREIAAGREPTRAKVRVAIEGAKSTKPRLNSGPKPARRKNKPTTETVAASLVLDEGKSYGAAAQETGVGSVQIVKIAVAREEGRREAQAEPPIDVATLSLTAQQKLEVAIRQHQRKLDEEFERRVQDEIAKRIDELVLPHYNQKIAEADALVKARKGVMKRASYRKILACLHPDRVTDPELKAQYEQAFHIFRALELVFLDEKELPTSATDIPRTYSGMMARRKVKRPLQTASALKPA